MSTTSAAVLLVKLLQLDERLATASGGTALSPLDGPIATFKCSMRSRKLLDSVLLPGVALRTMSVCNLWTKQVPSTTRAVFTLVRASTCRGIHVAASARKVSLLLVKVLQLDKRLAPVHPNFQCSSVR